MEKVNHAFFKLKYVSFLPFPSIAFVSHFQQYVIDRYFGCNYANIWNIQLKYPSFLSKFAILH